MLVRPARGGRPHSVTAYWRRSARRFFCALLAASLPLHGCSRGAASPNLNVIWTLSPPAPTVGPAALSVVLRDRAGAPVKNAAVRLEGQMTHAGMTPVLATATERAPGVYDLSFAFTMAGDWALLVTATLPDGTRVEHRIDVANVKPS
jgi:YtkA-like protein